MIKVKHIIYRNVDINNGRFSGGSYGKKNLPASAGHSGDPSLIPGSGRFSGGGNGNPLQYSCLDKRSSGGLQSMGWVTDSDTTE